MNIKYNDAAAGAEPRGLSLRDYAAVHIAAGAAANVHLTEAYIDRVADFAVQLADALLVRLEREDGGE